MEHGDINVLTLSGGGSGHQCCGCRLTDGVGGDLVADKGADKIKLVIVGRLQIRQSSQPLNNMVKGG